MRQGGTSPIASSSACLTFDQPLKGGLSTNYTNFQAGSVLQQSPQVAPQEEDYLELGTHPVAAKKFADADEVVSSGGEHEEPLDQGTATMAGLAQSADGLSMRVAFWRRCRIPKLLPKPNTRSI
jgi:hypothetical protein